jgi:hypothetical protein
VTHRPHPAAVILAALASLLLLLGGTPRDAATSPDILAHGAHTRP